MKNLLNYKEWTKTTFWVVFGMTFVISFGLGASEKREVVKEVPIEVVKEVEKVVNKCDDEDKWRALKDVDQEIIDLSTQAILLSSDSFFAISEMDMETVTKNTSEINKLTPKVEAARSKRDQLLKDLGY